MIVNLIVGDWSRDGHEKTDRFTVESNLSKAEIAKAYKAGAKLIGFDITEYCKEFEDNTIPIEKLRLLCPFGLIWEDLDSYSLEEGEMDGLYRAMPGEYVNFYLLIVKAGNPTFEYSYTKGPDIKIGGYGLYCL